MRKPGPRWLLLAVSAFCMLVLAPASALSQGSRVTAGCGTAQVDGVMAPGEWKSATRVALTDAAPMAAHTHLPTSGLLYLMNDKTNLYVAAAMNLEAPPTPEGTAAPSAALELDDWYGKMCLMFTDEGNAEDDEWEAAGCEPPPGEGQFCAEQRPPDEPHPGGADFKGWSQAQPCCNVWVPTKGVEVEALSGSDVTIVWEWKVDLTASELDKVAPDGCFRLGAWNFVASSIDFALIDGHAMWPSGLAAPLEGTLLPEDWEAWPDTFGALCLNPCSADFVPEPGTIALLGSGLMGLAGYAALRIRSGQALRWRARA